ncbi:unnamed protein product [Triticum turgidum subsp. durum]|uniref:Uncharacterized protein n=1 Tax=Triticum turgidum subsp. durum TaxID=4567 RepID=A0A9R0TBQ8_TRITD|nr:unnamed protein product [Triticum turgidum subsp. durum]
MASKTIEIHRVGAEIFRGDDAMCKKKCVEVLEEKKTEHTFKKVKQTVSYAGEVTAFVEPGKLRKIAGVKTKELFLWLSVVEVYVDESVTAPGNKVTFKTGTGLSETFDAAAFALGE